VLKRKLIACSFCITVRFCLFEIPVGFPVVLSRTIYNFINLTNSALESLIKDIIFVGGNLEKPRSENRFLTIIVVCKAILYFYIVTLANKGKKIKVSKKK